MQHPWPPRPCGRSVLCLVESSWLMSHPNACTVAKRAASCWRRFSIQGQETCGSFSLPNPTVIGPVSCHMQRGERTHQACVCQDKGKPLKTTGEQCKTQHILHELERQGLKAIQKARLIRARTEALQDLNPGRMKFKNLL